MSGLVVLGLVWVIASMIGRGERLWNDRVSLCWVWRWTSHWLCWHTRQLTSSSFSSASLNLPVQLAAVLLGCWVMVQVVLIWCVVATVSNTRGVSPRQEWLGGSHEQRSSVSQRHRERTCTDCHQVSEISASSLCHWRWCFCESMYSLQPAWLWVDA